MFVRWLKKMFLKIAKVEKYYCSDCGRRLWKGYCIFPETDKEKHYCEKCLTKHYTYDEYAEISENMEAYCFSCKR